MFSRFGLRFHMAVSYVAVSAAAVLIVEAVLLAVLVPRLQTAKESVLKAQQTAEEATVSSAEAKAKGLAAENAYAAENAARLAGAAQPELSDRQLLIRAAQTAQSGSGTAQLLATVEGTVVDAPVPGGYAVGSRLPAGAAGPAVHTGVIDVGEGRAVWATHPIGVPRPSAADLRMIGIVYVQMPIASRAQVSSQTRDTADGVQAFYDAGALWIPAVIVLALLVPVGGLFGLLSTRWLIHRIRRLAAGTSEMAAGNLHSRIPVSGGDELGQLERGFNQMAERLEAAVRAERDAAGADARRAERTRITRELHDSVSQDLFSASLLAGGLRKALPNAPELRHQAASLEQTLERTRREMRAMMLELRPVALEDAGLAAAVDRLCRAYEVRLGIQISTDIGPLHLTPQVEHAVLRVVQEALGNAVRHASPETIELTVTDGDGRVTVMIRDDGQGFDLLLVGERHGMGLELMRERVAELGGELEVTSAPEQGTTVLVLIPDGAA